MKELDREVARYVDGEMSRDEAAAFEARVGSDPAVRRAMDELQGLGAWFVPGRAAPAPAPSKQFRQRVLAEAFAPPSMVGDVETTQVRSFGLRLVCAAAIMVIAAVLVAVVASGRNAGTGRLEASPADVQRAMAELDARIEAAVGAPGVAPADGARRR